MKNSVLLLFAVGIAGVYGLSDELKQKIVAKGIEVIGACKGESGISSEDLAGLAQKKPPESKEGKCFIFCIHKHMKLQDESGKYTVDVAKKMVMEKIGSDDPDLASKMTTLMDKCVGSLSGNPDACESSVEYMKCGMQGFADMGINPKEVLGL